MWICISAAIKTVTIADYYMLIFFSNIASVRSRLKAEESQN